MTAKFEFELERRITKHLEAWADWNKMSEDEQDQTFDEIHDIVTWAIKEALKEEPKNEEG